LEASEELLKEITDEIIKNLEENGFSVRMGISIRNPKSHSKGLELIVYKITDICNIRVYIDSIQYITFYGHGQEVFEFTQSILHPDSIKNVVKVIKQFEQSFSEFIKIKRKHRLDLRKLISETKNTLKLLYA